MPDLSKSPWLNLVKLTPVDDHTEEIDAKFWQPFFQQHSLTQEYQNIFSNANERQISRDQLLNNA